jgi:hypothetical protein
MRRRGTIPAAFSVTDLSCRPFAGAVETGNDNIDRALRRRIDIDRPGDPKHQPPGALQFQVSGAVDLAGDHDLAREGVGLSALDLAVRPSRFETERPGAIGFAAV